jgi:hypothetical protein
MSIGQGGASLIIAVPGNTTPKMNARANLTNVPFFDVMAQAFVNQKIAKIFAGTAGSTQQDQFAGTGGYNTASPTSKIAVGQAYAQVQFEAVGLDDNGSNLAQFAALSTVMSPETTAIWSVEIDYLV